MSASEHQRMFVGGAWVDAADGARLESINPATGAVLGMIPDAGPDDVARAVDAARAASESWGRRSGAERAASLRELARRMAEHSEAMARLDSLEAGLPISAMRRDAANASARVAHFAGLASELKGSSFDAPDGVLAWTAREPYGVAARIIPFNHPYLFSAKVASALVAGNAVVLKPAETGALSALALARLSVDLLPPGVLNVVTGRGAAAGRALVQHPDVPRISFTGGLASGRAVLREAAEHIKHVTLELGGRNPMLVFPDVSVVEAADACVKSNHLAQTMGQSCQATARVLVHEAVHDAFVARLAERLAALRAGDPLDAETQIGPLNNQAHYERVCALVARARSDGARVVTGGRRPPQLPVGWFLEPTLLSEVTDDMEIAREEAFGPVICVSRWRDSEEALRRANATPFGLTANVWSRDIAAGIRAAQALRAGYVWVNGQGTRIEGTPFGGFKLSGLGQEGGMAELLSFTREKMLEVHLG